MAEREKLSGIPTDPSAPPLPGPSRPALEVGRILANRYEIRGRIGAGGMGSVWRAYDRELEEEIALKIIREHKEAGVALERFRREVKIARRLSHPGVCRVFDYGEADGLSFLTMELIEGQTLRAHLATGPLMPERALDIVEQIASGMAAVHAQGVIHRDLKPENVILREDGRAVVVDFGLARGPVVEHKSAHFVSGTPTYMAPEQLRGEPLDLRCDVFALGLLTAELLTGRSPFEQGSAAATTSAILRDRPHPLAAPNLPRWMATALDDVLAKALAKSPEGRFSSADEFAAALLAIHDRVRTSGMVQVKSRPEPGPPRRSAELLRRIRGHRGWFVAGALAAAMVATALGVALREPGGVRATAAKAILAAVGPRGITRPMVLVLPFQNLTSEQGWDDLCRSATESIGAGLRKLPDTVVLDGPRAGDAAAEAERKNATWVVTGSVQRIGGLLRLAAQVRSASGHVVGEPIEVDGAPAQPALLLDQLRQRALDEVRLLWQEHDRERRAIQGTRSEDARNKLLQYYAMIGPGLGPEHLQVGKRLLDEAIEADGAYAGALVERAYLQARGAGAPTQAERLVAGLLDLDRALEVEPGNPAALVMRCRLLQVSMEVKGAPTDEGITEVLDACGAALQAEPSSAHVRVVLARVYDRTCQDEQAMAALEKAHELDRSLTGRSLSHLVELSLQNGKLSVADRVSRELVDFQEEERRRGVRALSQRAGLPPTSGAHILRAAVLLRLSQDADAGAVLERYLHEMTPGQEEDRVAEASALRGLLRVAARSKAAPPAGAKLRLGVLEAEFRAGMAKDPRMGLQVASAYRWTDPDALEEWIVGAEGAGETCDFALQRALLHDAAGKPRAAQLSLDACRPKHRWEEGCIEWVKARVGR